MRRIVPTLLLAALGALTLGAAALGVSSSPRYVYFATPSPGTPDVVSAFRGLVRHTLEQRSFTVHQNGATLVYQAPNRSEYVGGLSSTIVIGGTSYVALSSTKSRVDQWGEYHLTRNVEQSAGPRAAKSALVDFVTASSIVLRSGSYEVKEVVPIGEIEPDHAGQLLIEATVRPLDGRVATISVVAFGLEPKLTWTIRYSAYGSSPSIIAPPRNRTVRLIPCRDGATEESGPAGYECGLLGEGSS